VGSALKLCTKLNKFSIVGIVLKTEDIEGGDHIKFWGKCGIYVNNCPSLGTLKNCRKATISFVLSFYMAHQGSHWMDFHEF